MMHSFRVFHSLQKAQSTLFRAADYKLKQSEDITASQNAVLFILMKGNGIPMGSIAKQLNISKSSLSSMIDKMITKGLLRRDKNQEDGRVILIFIEAAGLDIIKRTASAIHQVNARILAPFNEAERNIIDRFLTHVETNAIEIVKDA